MSAIRLDRPHQLDKPSRVSALEQLCLHLRDTLGAEVSRSDCTLSFEGKGFFGEVTIGPNSIEGEVRLGLLMRPLKGAIKREIEAGLAQYLDGASPGEDL